MLLNIKHSESRCTFHRLRQVSNTGFFHIFLFLLGKACTNMGYTVLLCYTVCHDCLQCIPEILACFFDLSEIDNV